MQKLGPDVFILMHLLIKSRLAAELGMNKPSGLFIPLDNPRAQRRLLFTTSVQENTEAQSKLNYHHPLSGSRPVINENYILVGASELT